MVTATPVSGRPDLVEYGGATINVYTVEPCEESARELAFREIRDAGWEPHEIEDQLWLTRAELTETPEGLEYFEQALQDGTVLVVYTYPAGSEPEGSVH